MAIPEVMLNIGACLGWDVRQARNVLGRCKDGGLVQLLSYTKVMLNIGAYLGWGVRRARNVLGRRKDVGLVQLLSYTNLIGKNIQVPRDAASVHAALSMATPWSVIKVDYQHAKDMATFRGERKRRVIEPGTWNIEFPVRIEAVLGTQSFVLSHSLVSVDFSPHKFHTVFLRPDDSCQTVKTNKR
jgi:hypothetical protein